MTEMKYRGMSRANIGLLDVLRVIIEKCERAGDALGPLLGKQV